MDSTDEHATIITGAGSGIGRALAVALSRRGPAKVKLVLVGRRAAKLAETRSACVDLGVSAERCLALSEDVGAPHTAEVVIGRTLEQFGSIGALVNNAAHARFAPIAMADPDDWLNMVQVNMLGPVRLIKSALPALRASRGVVVNVGSIGGVLALPGRALYGASKAALLHLTRSLARELAPEVRVNAVLPGPVQTPMYDDLGLNEEDRARLLAEMVRTTPLGRLGTVNDVVPWIELLLGPAGQWVTGSLIHVDGGRSC